MVTKEDVIKVLKKVMDPELYLDIYSLGLIYGVEIKKDLVEITMTFTSYACPYGPMLLEEVHKRVEKIKGVKKATIELTFDPPWQLNDEIRATLGI